MADLARERESHLQRRRLLVRAVLATGAVAAVALGAVGVVSRGAPTSAQPAYTRVVRRVLAALDQATNTILHVTVNGTETTTSGHSTSWTDESYLNFGPLTAGFSWSAVETGFRQIITQPGGLGVLRGRQHVQAGEFDLVGAGDSRVKLRFQAYQQLSMAGNTGLLSLNAPHPGATIDADAGDYESAQARLFPTLTRPVCLSGIINPTCARAAHASRFERHRRSSARSSCSEVPARLRQLSRRVRDRR